MKKLTYLFLALLIVACSSDDSSNEDAVNQLFLNIYDGLVWKLNSESPGDIGTDKLTFYSDPPSLTVFDDEFCDTIIFGVPSSITNEAGVELGEFTYTIQNEEQNNIVFSGQVVYNEDLGVDSYTVTVSCTVSSSGNTLLNEFFISNQDVQQSETYTIAPDEFPCN